MIALRLRPITGCLALLVGLTAVQPLRAQSPSAYSAAPDASPTYPSTSTPVAEYSWTKAPPPSNYSAPQTSAATQPTGPALSPSTNSAPPATNTVIPPPSNSGLSAPAPNSTAASPVPSTGSDLVVREVRIEGNHTTRVEKLPKLSTRVGQPFDPHIIEEDVRLLASSHKFLDVRMQYQQRPDGIVVIFQVVERPTLQYVKFVGNQDITSRTLLKKSELKEKDPLDPYAVEEARRRLESVYHEKGYNHVQITTIEGSKPGDHGAVLMVDEGQSQRVLWTSFEGNTIASAARLRTQIKIKPGIMWLFGGKVDRKKIDEDVDHLTAYYRSLGFFQAKIGPDLQYSEEKDWLQLKYVINEGPRYSIRNVSFLGNEKFKNEELVQGLELGQGKPFNQASLNRDLSAIRDVYGGHGYIFADVQADPRLLEDKPELDLVYQVKEGKRYRVGMVNVHVSGENPHTAHSTILDRMSLRPGDVVDTRKIRADERRLKYSGLFSNDPTKGSVPKIVFNKPSDAGDDDSQVADRKGSDTPQPPPSSGPGGRYRSQSPDDEVVVDVTYARDQAGKDAVVLTSRTAGYQPESQSPTTIDGVRVRFQSPNPAWSDYSAPSDATRARDAWGMPPSGASTMSQGYLPPSAQPLPPNMATSSPPPPAYNPVPAPSSAAPYSAPAYSVPPQNAYSSSATPYSSSPPIQTNNYQGAAPANTLPPGYSAVPLNQPATGTPAPGTIVQTTPPQNYPPATTPAPVYAPGTVPQPQYSPATSYPPSSAPLPAPLVAPPPTEVVAPGDIALPPLMGGPDPTIPLEVQAQETQTGRLMLGVGVNSDAGLVGNFVLDEQNFDITRLPRSWEDVRNGTAWRGAGEGLRLEANPGTQVQRYAATFREPYLYETPAGWLQMSVSGYYFTRIYENWTEGRVGGKVGLGIALTPDFTVRTAFRGERVDIYNPQPSGTTVPELINALGAHDLYGFSLGASHDTRDSPFLPTQGHLLSVDFEEIVGSFQYPHVDVQARQYYLLRQRADGSGRHVFSIGGEFGVTGADTPIYDNFFPGGFSSLRGFAFRGAAPRSGAVVIGGQFELLGTAEYMFPITADDALRGVVFCDFGTAEKTVAINGDQFRVAPGFGLRINVPAMGPAPIALDFAVPVANAPGDQVQNFSFFVGLGRSY